MPLPNVRLPKSAAFDPEADQSQAALRLADAADAPVSSPVHRLQSELSVFEARAAGRTDGHYPGWFRLGFPMAGSAALWGAILWSVGLVR
ncbi:hypothetical protein OLX02_00865 [Novosphingobium sp. KCTC 2891]|uniref:hypothetical protein n=1 Tax=Novosphingobium sp. KCTC 2891 TaxID=2989730 RepID=UPI002221AE8B|nr:hypothetical protein [Novosphingobium sp. KCTC 2891]MCW1381363.1 hypothetical protein [Novosphingobium sp. KCTC 2891]